ncbi:hypothetical protein JNL27_16560, partial [bacterium]|nr:hypothetical protein [bacterium]
MTRLTLFCLLLIFSMHRAYSQDNSYQDDYYNGLIIKAEKKASEDGRNVLETGRTMTLKNKEILPGS